ncbi:hypothetical protein Tco_1515349 [Tanacetum coccineum]
MASTRASISKASKRSKINIIPPKQLFVDLTQDDTKTPSPKLPILSPSAPNAPSKTPSTKDTSSSSIDYIPKSPTSSTSLSPSDYLNPPTSPPPRVSPPPPNQENASMDITLTLSPITPLDVKFDTPSPSPPIIGHPIPWNLLEAHGSLVSSCLGLIRGAALTPDLCSAISSPLLVSGISASKEVDIGLGEGRDKPLRPADMDGLILYRRRAVIEVTQRKCIKYEAKWADIGYGFIPFSFSSFGELENDAVALLNQIQKFFVMRDIRARTTVHIFSRISFAIEEESGILAGKEIDIELGFSPLTQTGMVDFVPGHAVFDATHPKRVKYKVECSVIRYDFLAFLFSLLGELEKDAVAIGLTEADSKVGDPLFSVSKSCLACSKVFTGDIYGDKACITNADMLLYSWDEGLDVCVDLTGSSPLTQTGMVDFVPGRAVIDAAHRKRVKYEAKCANIGYGFLPLISGKRQNQTKPSTGLRKARENEFNDALGFYWASPCYC